MKARVARTIHYGILVSALIFAAAIPSIVSPSRAYAASAAFVQGGNLEVASGTTASVAFPSVNTSGNLIVAYVVWDNPGTVTVSDTKGNTYTAATARQTWGHNWSAQVFYAPNIVGGSNTVKATFGTAITSFGIVYLHEYTGLATASPLDVSVSGTGTSASMSSGAVTTTQANDIIFAAGASDNTVTTPGTGFTTRLTGSGNLTEDRIATTPASYAGTATQNGSTWVMQLLAFRVASAAAGPPAKLGFVQGPSNAAAGAVITPAVKVAVEDANGNIETSDNATKVTLAIGTNPAGGTLSGGSAVTVASGIATFSGLSINTAGTGYTLTASSTPTYSAATSVAFNITSGTSSDWTTYLQGNSRSGFAAGEDGFNPTSVPKLGVAWQTADAGPAHGVFSQPILSNGLVYWGSFDGYERATNTSGNLVWQTNLGTESPPGCSDPSEAGIASTATVTTDVPVGTATSVVYVGGGNAKLYALNAATGAVLWSYAVGPNSDYFVWSSPAVFGNSVYIGVASFGDCPLVQGQLLQLNRVTGALQNTFDVVPNGCTGGGVWGSPTIDAAAGTIYFDTGNAGTCTSGEPLAPAVVEVHASDLSLVGSWAVPPAQQADDSDFGATPTLFTGVIGGQSEPLVGVINKNGTFYTFERDALPSGPVWSTKIAIGGGDPPIGQGDAASAAFDGTRLYVGGDATNSCSGSLNALNPSTGAFIWQHCFTDGGFVLGGVTSTSGGVVAVGEGNNIAVVSAATGASLFTYAGKGTFWGPSSIAGGTLYEGDMAGNLYALTVNQIGPPAKLGFVQGPSNAAAGAVITPAVKVAVEDANGNIETSDNATKVTLAIGTNPAGGTLSGGSAVTVASGIATFSGLSINTAGTGYTLTASSTPTYSAATSVAFNITSGTSSAAFVQGGNLEVASGTTASVAFPSANTSGNLIVAYVVWDNPGTVTVSDTKGNTYTAATARQTWGHNWSAQVFYAPNIVGGSNTVKATFGTAITSFGIVYLHEYTGLATASPLDVSASGTGTSASMSSGAVTTTQANDLIFAAGASDNTVTTPGTGFTTRLTGSGNLTEDRIATTPASYAGTATQNGSTWVMQLLAFRVASAAAGPPAKLGFVQGPSNAAAGAVITPAVKVAVEDANGNIETSDNATKVTLAIGTNPAGGTLSGGSAVTVASGIATFSGLSINTAGTGYTLTASSTPTYSAATSVAFNITSGTSSAAFVQGGNLEVASGTTASVAFPSANTSGNLIVAYVVWDNPGTVTVSDTKGNTYTAATARQTWGHNWSAQVFYAPNIVGGSNTVKATFGTAITSFGIVYLHEYTGLATASPLDVSASGTGTSASMSSGAVTTTQANDLIFAAGASDNTVTTPGTGFTTRLTGSGNLTEDRIATTPASYAGTATQNGSTWVMQLLAFRVA